MRIGMVLDKAFPPDPRVEQEAKALMAHGHEVILFCASKIKRNKDIVKGIQVVYYYEPTWLYKLSALAYTLPFYQWIMQHKIQQFVLRHKPDILHVHDIQVGEAVRKVSLKNNLNYVLDLHENRPAIMPFYQHIKKGWGRLVIFPKVWQFYEQKLIQHAQAVVVVTGEAKTELMGRLDGIEQKILVVPNTVNQSFFKHAEQVASIDKVSSHFSMLYIGDTGLRRGLETVIDALNILKDEMPNLRLVVLGKSKEDQILKDKMKYLGVADMVFWEGWKSPDSFQSYISSSSVCLSPLHRNLHHNTTYANKLFQYMAYGKPLLVSDADAQKNLVDKIGAGLVHKEKNVEDFCEKIRLLYKEDSMSQAMGKKGEQFVRSSFYFEKTVQPLLDFYAQVEK